MSLLDPMSIYINILLKNISRFQSNEMIDEKAVSKLGI